MSEVVAFYKKWVEPFIALGILVMLLLLGYFLSQEQDLKREISENCDWGEEDYRCYCKKSDVLNIEYVINGSLDLPSVEIVE